MKNRKKISEIKIKKQQHQKLKKKGNNKCLKRSIKNRIRQGGLVFRAS